MDLDQEAVLTGDAVTFGDPGEWLGELGELGELPGGGTDPGVDHDRQAEGSSVDFEPVPVMTPARSRRCTRSVTAGRAHVDPTGQSELTEEERKRLEAPYRPHRPTVD